MFIASKSLQSTLTLQTRQKKVDAHKRVKSIACDVCRFRKVRCIQLHEDSQACEACIKRKTKCQFTPSVRSANTHHVAIGTPNHNTTPTTNDLVPISHHSPNSSLQRVELSETFMADLLATFFEHSEEQAPYANHTAVQTMFEQAGRRLDRVAPALEPFILAMCAASVQVSDSPLLLGSHAPRLKELTTVHQTSSLLQFGRRRQAVCAQLARRLVDLTDMRGLFRKPSPESIAVLTLIPRILRYPLPWKGLEDIGDIWRPFMGAAFSHIRTLLESPGASLGELNFLRWIMVINDAYNSALEGSSLLAYDSDVSELPMISDLPLVTPQMTRRLLLSENMSQTVIPILAIANKSIKMGRLISKTISIPLRKRRRVELSTFSERIKETRGYLKVVRECSDIAQQVLLLIPPAILESQKQMFGVYMPTSVKYAPVSPTFLMLALHKQFELYTQHHISVTLMEESTKSELNEVKRVLDMGMLDAIFIVADAIRGLEGKDVVASLTRQTSMMIGIQEQLLLFFRIACEIGTAEQNGCSADWTHTVKCQTLRLLLDAAQLQAWSWGDREEELANCEYQYRQYKNSSYYQTLGISTDLDTSPGEDCGELTSASSAKSSPISPSDHPRATSADSIDVQLAVEDPFAFVADISSYTDLWSGELYTDMKVPTVTKQRMR